MLEIGSSVDFFFGNLLGGFRSTNVTGQVGGPDGAAGRQASARRSALE